MNVLGKKMKIVSGSSRSSGVAEIGAGGGVGVITEALQLLHVMIAGKEKIIEALEQAKKYPITSDILRAQRMELEHLELLRELLTHPN